MGITAGKEVADMPEEVRVSRASWKFSSSESMAVAMEAITNRCISRAVDDLGGYL